MNKKRISTKVIALVILGLSVMGIAITRISVVNATFPSEEIKKVAYKEYAEWNNIEMAVSDVSWMPYEISIDDDCFAAYIVYVTFVIRNTSGDEQQVDLTPLCIETDGYCNGIDLEMFVTQKSENDSLVFTLERNSSKTCMLPFVVSELLWKKNDWRRIREKDFHIVYYNYPNEIKWEIMQ